MKSNPGVAAKTFETLAARGHQHRDDLHLAPSGSRASCARPRSSRPCRPCTPPSSSSDALPTATALGRLSGAAVALSPCASESSAPPARSVASCSGSSQERAFPVDELRVFASARSAGRTLAFAGRRGHRRGRRHRVATTGLDLALFSAGRHRLAGARARGRRRRRHGDRQLVGLADGPRRAARGARGQRRRPAARSRRASSPTRTARRWSPCRCSSRSTSRPGSQSMVVSTYQAVSGGGLAGTAELDEQVRKVADRRRRAHPRRRAPSTSPSRRRSRSRSPST